MAQQIPYPSLPKVRATHRSSSVDTDIWLCFQESNALMVGNTPSYRAQLETFRKKKSPLGKIGSSEFVRFGGQRPAESVLYVGLGEAPTAQEETARRAGALAYSKLAAAQVETVQLPLECFRLPGRPFGQEQIIKLALAFLEGLLLSQYQFTHRKRFTRPRDPYHLREVYVVCGESALSRRVSRALPEVLAAVEAVNVARHWSNEPSNFGTPIHYATEAQRIARSLGLKAKVLTERECARLRMDLFLAVGKGSSREGRVVILEHQPKPWKGSKTIALVGKGITFDAGGISIKPAARMEDMKHDMTGAATVMGAMVLAARWNIPHRVVAVMAFTENMPDGEALQPSNVISTRAGKTVEIVNTDAEGRLILADALDLAQDYKPETLIDLATLTGAVSVALGKICAGVFGNDEALVDRLRSASEMAGEKLWQLPLHDEYFDDLRSDVADMKNSANDAHGGSIRGAAFLKQFIRKGVAWAHFDMANVAYNVTHVPYYPKKGASGALVRTLGHFLKNY